MRFAFRPCPALRGSPCRIRFLLYLVLSSIDALLAAGEPGIDGNNFTFKKIFPNFHYVAKLYRKSRYLYERDSPRIIFPKNLGLIYIFIYIFGIFSCASFIVFHYNRTQILTHKNIVGEESLVANLILNLLHCGFTTETTDSIFI